MNSIVSSSSASTKRFLVAMARLNISEDFWTDPRLDILTAKIGCRDRAAGMLLRAFTLAQRYWVPKHGECQQLIPFEIWDLSGFGPLIEAGLAQRMDSGIYVKGSRDWFQWIIDARERGRQGGLKSAVSRAEKYGSSNPKHEATLKLPSSSASCLLQDDTKQLNRTEFNSKEENTRESICPESEQALSAVADPPAPAEELSKTHPLQKIWNEHRGKLPEAKALNAQRLKAARARLKENPSLEQWVEVVKKIAASKFCNGESDRGWVASFDFLVKPGTFLKVMEGSYDNRTDNKNKSSGSSYRMIV